MSTKKIFKHFDLGLPLQGLFEGHCYTGQGRFSAATNSRGNACYPGYSLRSKRFQSRYCAKVRPEAKKKVEGEGEGRRGRRRFLHFPPPPPSFIFFFCSCPSFLDEPREETLPTQVTQAIFTLLKRTIFFSK